MKSPERRSIKGRVYLVLQDRNDADQLARELDAMGWPCAVATEEQDHGVSRIRDAKPVAVIADGSDLGISTAAAMRADSTTLSRSSSSRRICRSSLNELPQPLMKRVSSG